jgi:hypothetical protein
MVARCALVVVLGAACTGTISGNPGGGGNSTDASVPTTPGQGSIARGMMWVAAMVPYCQAPNHQPDGDASCASICTRPDVPAWDPYRSDCSGFVSWSWELPAPGRTTADFAPFTTDITHEIDSSQLRPGDAINNDEHVMLFEEWTQVGSEAKFLEEPGCSASQPYAREVTVSVTTNGSTVSPAGYGDFIAIRYDSAP